MGPQAPATAPQSRRRALEVDRRADVRAKVDAIRDQLDQIEEVTASIDQESSDPFGAAGDIFAEELRSLLGDTAPDRQTVRRAALLAVADQAWEARLGRLLETRDVAAILRVSKQRVSTLVGEHRIVALPQGARVRFPAWQFAVSGEHRECLATAHEHLVDRGALSPWTAASWFQEEHPELDGHDPVTFLKGGGNPERLMLVAARDAERLSH